MAGRKRDKVKEGDLRAFKYFKVLAGLLETLQDAACDRDAAAIKVNWQFTTADGRIKLRKLYPSIDE